MTCFESRDVFQSDLDGTNEVGAQSLRLLLNGLPVLFSDQSLLISR